MMKNMMIVWGLVAAVYHYCSLTEADEAVSLSHYYMQILMLYDLIKAKYARGGNSRLGKVLKQWLKDSPLENSFLENSSL